jgi:hypothetical protein
MKPKEFMAKFIVTFGVAFIVNIVISICWNYFIKGEKWVIDWETSFRFAILFAIIIPLTQIKRK